MKHIIIKLIFSSIIILHFWSCSNSNSLESKVWSVEKANAWYAEHDWMIGANFSPSTAINQLEFWQEESYDPETIDRELGYAHDIGMNVMRVYLHYLVWVKNPTKMKDRIEDFLSICKKHDIKIMFVFFDDCWGNNCAPHHPGIGEPILGKQPEPVFGTHNSGWVENPGAEVVDDKALFPVLKAFVQDIMIHFRSHEQVLMWDLYNEPGNNMYNADNEELPKEEQIKILMRTYPLLTESMKWAREANVEQPITVGLWQWNEDFEIFNEFQAANSDIITFHDYNSIENFKEERLPNLLSYGRPLICTEYVARTRGNTFETHLPTFKEYNIGAINWGLVKGKTNTVFQWDSLYTTDDPDLWFHDIFRKDGTPFDQKEIDLIKSLINLGE